MGRAAAMTLENDSTGGPRPAPRDMAAGGGGLRIIPGYLDRPAQEELLAALREIMRVARATCR